MELIQKKELKEFHEELGLIIDEVDTHNPIDVMGFATSLISMGRYLLTKNTSRLIAKTYSEKQIKKFQEDINNKKPKEA